MEPWKRTFYASWLGQFLSITGFMSVLPFMPFFIRHLGVTNEADLREWSGIIGSSAGLTLGLFAPLWGLLADRYGRKPMVLRSMVGGAVILTVMGYSQNVTHLLICRFIQGALTGTVTASVAMVASVTPRQHAGFTLGMMQAAVSVGAAVGPAIGGAVADAFGYKAAFATAGAVLLAAALIVAWGVEEPERKPAPAAGQSRGGFGALFAATGFLAAVGALFAIRFSYSLGTPVFPLLVEDIRGNSQRIATVTGVISAVGGVAAAVAAGLTGFAGQRWGNKAVLVVFTLFAASIAALHAVAYSIAMLVLLRILFGIGMGGMFPTANTIIRHVVHDSNIGKAYGITSSVGAIGWTIGPMVGGYTAKYMGLRVPFLVMAASLLVAAATVAAFVKPSGASRSKASAGE